MQSDSLVKLASVTPSFRWFSWGNICVHSVMQRMHHTISFLPVKADYIFKMLIPCYKKMHGSLAPGASIHNSASHLSVTWVHNA